ncbi:MAG: AbrB/MazE/SpoVT family DNA-binding domain-containing protein [Candidatus Hydrothermarchaeaceae archaeon]
MKQEYLAHAKVTVRKQIAIPKKVREKLDNIGEGDYLLFYEKGGEIYIKKGVLVPQSK